MPTQAMPEVQHLLTIKQAAARLGVSERTLWRLIAAWKFPHPVRINSAPRILLSDLEGYIAKLAADRPAK